MTVVYYRLWCYTVEWGGVLHSEFYMCIEGCSCKIMAYSGELQCTGGG